jgi:cell filamentation protein
VTDDYCWPDTDCLRNKLDIRDAAELRAVEAQIVSVRDVHIATNTLPGQYDAQHFRAFHKSLFGDLYDWAGETRIVDIDKGVRFGHWRYVDDQLAGRLRELRNDQWLVGLRRVPFLDRIAYYYGEINAIHPFREGNGRTQRAFLRQLCAAAGWSIDWTQLDKDANDLACAENLVSADSAPLRELLEPIVSRI